MGKPTFCICENKGADQLFSNCEADRRFWFRYTDNIIPLLSGSNISGPWPSDVTARAGLLLT